MGAKRALYDLSAKLFSISQRNPDINTNEYLLGATKNAKRSI